MSSTETSKKPHDKLMAYKTLVIINLSIAIGMLILRWWISAIMQLTLSGDTSVGDGPALFALAGIGALMIVPATLIILIAAAIITIYQSTKLVERKQLSMNSPWLLLAVIGIIIEVVAVFL